MMNNNVLHGTKIVLGVTGSIAAYKSADLVRRLIDAGAELRVVMTKGACEFITPLTLQTLSGHPVALELLDADQESAMGHIKLARWADWILIAPASADTIARLAHGRADDILAALCLASESPLVIAPAMNNKMWENPATQQNVALLQTRGV
ncbi:MAG TPA: bifunctional 4'-phosphopantothenoylcysteine decarboxylase/phosphopantothenoylcysteine synthetase, partial [Methylophaga sp.]|nr:bifunctional 4'-phosphopantothenoylcysteine decarboxylase/phosphopantothenoylcysteine synthetase [Methylophaga sp.]